MQEDWYTLIVGKGNVNDGLLRIVAFIALYICIFGALFWVLMGG